MKILALKGKANVGKTTTIRILYNLLLQNGYQCLNTTFNPNGGDFTAVFIMNGKKIGIASWGDFESVVKDKLTLLINQNCDVCICACRTRGGTITAIKSFRQYIHQFINKNIDFNLNTQTSTNNNDAQIIYSLL